MTTPIRTLPAFVLISGLGSSTIGAPGLTALAFTYVWQAEMRLFPMIACANSLKLAESVRSPKRRLVWLSSSRWEPV